MKIWARTLLIGIVAGIFASPARAGHEALLLIDAESGKVLQAENATLPWYPASVSKLMTTYVTLKAVRDHRITFDTLYTVSPLAASQQPTKMGLRTGTQVTVDNAIKMLLVHSANDMAVVLAEGLSGSIEKFAEEMTETSQALGMTQSSWVNPNGLPAEGQISSARDLGILARSLIRDFPEYDSYWHIPAIQFGRRVMRNFNSLIANYPGADGMKTGFICASGFNLVASATRGNRRLIAVVLGAPSSAARAAKAAAMLEHGFNGSSLSWLMPSLGTVESPQADQRRSAQSARRGLRSAPQASGCRGRGRGRSAGQRRNRLAARLHVVRPQGSDARRIAADWKPAGGRAADRGLYRSQAGARHGTHCRGRQTAPQDQGRRRCAGDQAGQTRREAVRRQIFRCEIGRKGDRAEIRQAHPGEGHGRQAKGCADRPMTTEPAGGGRHRGPVAPLPLTLLTGFLGAGKTTLLNRLLKDPALADTAVLINEFGEIGIDHLLVERVDGDVVQLSTGCLCCTVRGDLVDSLEKLLRDRDNGRAAFNRVMIETTGLADPAPVLHTIMLHPYLVMRFRLDGIVTVIDAVNGLGTLDAQPEAIKQIAVADRIVLTKADLVDTPARRAALDMLMIRVRALNPAAPILDAAAGEATPARLLNCGLYDPARKIPDVTRWLATEAHNDAHDAVHDGHAHAHNPNRHDDRIRAFVLADDRPIPAAAFDMFLDLLRSVHGPNLLRLKGIVKIAETPDRPVVVHGVQHVFHPTAQLDGWPDDDHRTRMVFIVRDIAPKTIKGLFDAFFNATSMDRPDRAALVDNPLVPFGGIDR